jgi:hypothetical protein
MVCKDCPLYLPAPKEVFLSHHGKKGKSHGKWDDGTMANETGHGSLRGDGGEDIGPEGATPDPSE